MKIALFSETYLPQINGVATHVKTLKEGLETLDHHVLVVTADPKATCHHLEHGILRCPASDVKPEVSLAAEDLRPKEGALNDIS